MEEGNSKMVEEANPNCTWHQIYVFSARADLEFPGDGSVQL